MRAKAFERFRCQNLFHLLLVVEPQLSNPVAGERIVRHIGTTGLLENDK